MFHQYAPTVLLFVTFYIHTDSSLEAPPSFKPAKKYSDLSGFEVSLQRHFILIVYLHEGICL